MSDLHPTTFLKAAAWVPDDDAQRPWEEAADLAAEWIWERSDEEGAEPLLVTNTFQNGRGIRSLSEIAGRGGHATPQGKERYNAGPVLAYVPDARTLNFALGLAHGYSLAVVESTRFPLAEWAAGADAINLIDGRASQSSIPDDVRKDLDRAVFFGGNNGWSGSHEKQHARSLLVQHIREGRLRADAAASYVMSQGVSDKGSRRLRDLLGRA